MTGRQRAAQAVTARRGELGLDRLELAEEAGIDPKTLYNLEVKHRWPIAVTRAKIEKALIWPSGEMERIASEPEGDLPTEEEVDDLRDHIREVLGEKAGPLQAALDQAVGRTAPPSRRRGRGAAADRSSAAGR